MENHHKDSREKKSLGISNKDKGKKHRKGKVILTIIVCVVLLVIVWKIMRATSSIPYSFEKIEAPITYSEEEKAMKAISLSYFVYGCEDAEDKVGTVREILEKNTLGIIIENFGLKRLNKADPTTAVINTADFVSNYVGNYRFLTDLTNKRCGFYGAAFCDDENKCIWISYSGTVSFTDVVACVGFALVPGLSKQEKMAFELMKTVMESDEVKNQSYSILLTGHSLGGALATEISLISGCEAITINGADGMAVDKIRSIQGEKLSAKNITNYMTSAKNGKTSFLDVVQRLMFIGSYKAVNYHIFSENGYTNDPHCAFSFLKCENGKYSVQEK